MYNHEQYSICKLQVLEKKIKGFSTRKQKTNTGMEHAKSVTMLFIVWLINISIIITYSVSILGNSINRTRIYKSVIRFNSGWRVKKVANDVLRDYA